ncbi:MAG: EamA family transporter [Halieaceae bacterium]|nr:EamA family transporter [Halieaceae bacterium]
MRIAHQFVALLVAFIWGTNFVFIRFGLDELQPFTLATLRFVLVAFPLILIIPRPRASWLHLASYGLFIGFGQFGLLYWVMQANITPGLASLILQMQVFFTVMLALVLMNETVRRQQLIALCVAFAGLALIIVYTDGHTTQLGVAVALVAAASWACGNMVIKKAGSVDILAFLVWSSLFSIPPLALMAWYSGGLDGIARELTQASWKAWFVVVWQSVGNTMIGYGLWNMLLNRYSAATVTPWALLVPVFGMTASAVLLAEPMPWWKLLAMALICAGLALNMTASRSWFRGADPADIHRLRR